ncbi:MAG: hypothetical protein ABI661_02665 [Gammaproteobacteria bacterium]
MIADHPADERKRWTIDIIDQTGAETRNYRSEEDGRQVRVD